MFRCNFIIISFPCTESKIKYLVILQTSEGEKESDQSTQSLDLGFPDDDDEPPQQEGETNYPLCPQ